MSTAPSSTPSPQGRGAIGWICRMTERDPDWRRLVQAGEHFHLGESRVDFRAYEGQQVVFVDTNSVVTDFGRIREAGLEDNDAANAEPSSGVALLYQNLVVADLTSLGGTVVAQVLADDTLVTGSIGDIRCEWQPVPVNRIDELLLASASSPPPQPSANAPGGQTWIFLEPYSASMRGVLTEADAELRASSVGEIGFNLLFQVLFYHDDPPTSDLANFQRLLREHSSAEGDLFPRPTARAGAEPPTVQVTTPLNRVFDEAQRLFTASGARDVVAVRHVVVALLEQAVSSAAGEIAEIFNRLGVVASVLHRAFLNHLSQQAPENEREFWAGLIRDRARQLAGFNADLAKGEDQLGVQRDVDAMAALIASVELQPPLSIGLFGNWGSGKSFFMQKLRDALADLNRPEQRSPKDFWPNIVSIEFNAWHYIDSNLWASLMAHIFDQLGRFGQTAASAPLDKALADLGLARAASVTAGDEQRLAQHALEDARAKLSTAESDLDATRRAFAAAAGKSAWSAVVEKFNAAADSDPRIADARKALGALTNDGGAAVASAEGLYREVKELTSVRGRLRLLSLRLLGNKRDGLTTKEWLGLGLVALLVAGLGGFLLWRNREVLGTAILVCGELTALLAAGARTVKKNLETISTAITPAREALTTLESWLRAAEEAKAQATAQLAKEVEQRLVEFQQANENAARAYRALAESKRAVVSIVTGQHILRFIESRAASGDYLKHLGIVSMVRSDFGRLSDLITLHNRARLDLLRTDQLSGSVTPSGLQKAGNDLKLERDVVERAQQLGDLGINRIVLFIDDLDRCPSDRVVEVLQAIHLLLAFPLFVVVVGVDSRWVTRALLDTHPTLFGRNKKGKIIKDDSVAGAPARPSDYLEKIFQIPYRLPDLDLTGSRKLLGALTASDQAIVGSAILPFQSSTTRAQKPGAPTAAAPGASALPKTATPAAAAKKATTTTLTSPAIAQLTLDRTELAAMNELAAIIGRSPRATKRFVNTYRLLRAAEPMLRHNFKPTLLLLAATTGTPTWARHLFTYLHTVDQSIATFGVLANEWINAHPDLEESGRLSGFLADVDSRPWLDLRVGDLKGALDRVAQFSFEEEVNLPKPVS